MYLNSFNKKSHLKTLSEMSALLFNLNTVHTQDIYTRGVTSYQSIPHKCRVWLNIYNSYNKCQIKKAFLLAWPQRHYTVKLHNSIHVSVVLYNIQNYIWNSPHYLTLNWSPNKLFFSPHQLLFKYKYGKGSAQDNVKLTVSVGKNVNIMRFAANNYF